MKKQGVWAVVLVIMIVFVSTAIAETIEERFDFTRKPVVSFAFPDMSDESSDEALYSDAAGNDVKVNQAIWPFGKKDEDSSRKKPKSTRKAFFLSLLVPGLGETYVGSKRGLLFLGVEAVAWWMYITNTNDGYDIEAEFRAFANDNWHYIDDPDDPLGHSYWDWLLEKKYVSDDTVRPDDYEKINKELYDNADISVHHYSGQGSQQDYEMVGKYPQFVYGWSDIVANNSALRDGSGKFNNNFDENIENVESPLRMKYEDMRHESNKSLKAGQRGIHIMIVNRILSAIDAGRLAFRHNKNIESELSSVRMKLVQKKILDNNVTMLTLTKKF